MRLAFEDCVFDSDTREVLKSRSPVSLSPKAFLLLQLLIGRGPKAVSKKEIHDCLWPKTFVAEGNLGNLIAEVRGALGDDARSPRMIRTVRRFGYAFRARVKEIQESARPA